MSCQHHRPPLLIAGVLAALAFAAVLFAPVRVARSSTGGSYSLTRSAIGGGGARASSGGAYSVGGIVLPPGTSPISGGSYAIRSGLWAMSGPPTADAEPPEPPMTRTTLLGVRPNPVVRNAWIRFELVAPSGVRLDVVDVNGRRVWGMDRGFAAGRHQVHWDGRDDAGRRLVPGIYFLVFEADGARSTSRLVKLD